MGESKLDKHRKEILDLLKMGVTKSRVAKDLGVNQSSLRYWLDSRGLQATSTNHPLHGEGDMMKISKKKLDKAKIAVREVYETYRGHDHVEAYTQAVLGAIEIEVEEPPVLPEGLSEGTWLPCCGHDADEGKYYIHANQIKIAEVYTSENRTFMAGSKEVTEKVVELMASYTILPSVWIDVINALEKQGCSVDKFR